MKHLVFRPAPHDDAVTFAPLVEAERVHDLHRALESSTWGEFRAAVGEALFATMFADHEPADLPVAGDEFNAEQVPGFSDGDFPPWLAPDMDRWIPRDLLSDFGRRTVTAVNGSFWQIPEGRAEAMAEALRGRGYVVERREDLRFW
jgi:hypothetical protein